MRSEQEMLDLIIGTAKNDDRIRAVIMNGSRANPNARRDIFQDFDIVYLVTEVDSFKNNPTWIERFGELMIMQLPETMQDPPPADDGGFIYLMQFMDGNRIDLGLLPITQIHELGDDSLSVLLLDKDKRVPPFAPSSDRGYLPTPPSAKAFDDCCNEFWWVCPYVAKGLWREETTYAKYAFDHYVRKQLMKMLDWYVGVNTDFSSNPGKDGKYLKHYLAPALWTMLAQTYADASYDNTWDALLVTGELFRKTAHQVAAHGGFEYPAGDDARVTAHLHHVRQLPKDATSIY